jgi:putative hydrolase of HD superfamily
VANWLITLWKEFDGGATSEARFAKAIDRCMPVQLNLSNQGGSWLETGAIYERVVGRVGPEIENGCPELWTYMKAKLGEARRKGIPHLRKGGRVSDHVKHGTISFCHLVMSSP